MASLVNLKKYKPSEDVFKLVEAPVIHRSEDIKSPVALSHKFVEVGETLFYFHRMEEVPGSHSIRFLVNHCPEYPISASLTISEYLGILVYDGECNIYTFIFKDIEFLGKYNSFEEAVIQAYAYDRF